MLAHTHMPFVRLTHGRLVINQASVSMPYGLTGAHWALLDPGAELRTTHFDIDAAVAQVTRDSLCPDIGQWADHFLRARVTDADAPAAFGPRNGHTETPHDGHPTSNAGGRPTGFPPGPLLGYGPSGRSTYVTEAGSGDHHEATVRQLGRAPRERPAPRRTGQDGWLDRRRRPANGLA
ncbi:hypothetical protein GCM10010279_28300 [Streptomyces mutabilis]|nr:hypothetical protein GCM10010279_28300 [Streptomyces mutabilis]